MPLNLPVPGPRYSREDESQMRRMVERDSRDVATALSTARALLAFLRVGTGDPEGVVSAPVGALFLREDGGANTTLYVKESGTGNTGWVAK